MRIWIFEGRTHNDFAGFGALTYCVLRCWVVYIGLIRNPRVKDRFSWLDGFMQRQRRLLWQR